MTRRWRACGAQLAAAVLACAAGQAIAQAVVTDAAAAAPTPDRRWALRVPGIEKVVYRGSVSMDSAGIGTGPILYPAPSPAGFLVAILAHGMVSAGMRESQKNQIQAEADRVLLPLAPVLAGMTHRELMERGVQRIAASATTRLLAPAESAGAEWLIDTAPVFSMTQDRRAIVLDNVVRIVPPGTAPIVYTQTVRVVSAPLLAPVAPVVVEAASAPAQAASAVPDAVAVAASAASAAAVPAPVPVSALVPADDPLVALWMAQQGQRVSDESAALLAESLDVAMWEFSAPKGDDKAPSKTFRYAEGGREKMERAQLVQERCGRALVRTLRGWLMSIPTAANGAACAKVAEPAAAKPAAAS